MAGIKIEFDSSVELYLNELIDTLYKKEYFSYKQSAFEYVEFIIDKIVNDIQLCTRKKASEYYVKRFGADLFEMKVHKNKSTLWYIYYNYNREQQHYKIRYIRNDKGIEQSIGHNRTRTRKK